ncbi:DUF1643 domain-containing protein [Lacticaseibacillus brantae]|uniref:DUF1643 domain-containing protein n=1 Tax=Lacticaseibacillus brantae TaxID=943673 RepID=UPI00070B37B8|nr:DUF1643 domain-containing protein [Lacticaseibacillus brantae]
MPNQPAILETIEVTSRTTAKNVFWVRWVWETELPQYLVIANYPSVGDPKILDVTRLLIMNHIRALKGGGVAIANLFSQPVEHLSDKALSDGSTAQGITEIINLAKQVDHVILAMGSLPDKSKVAKARYDGLITVIKEEKLTDKVEMLINVTSKKPAHPLSLQGRTWEFQPISEPKPSKKTMKKIADQ